MQKTDEKLKELKEYYVDFESWKVCATSSNRAEEIVLEKMHKGFVPCISSLDQDTDHSFCLLNGKIEMGNYIKIETKTKRKRTRGKT
jgi:hypothetical protein